MNQGETPDRKNRDSQLQVLFSSDDEVQNKNASSQEHKNKISRLSSDDKHNPMLLDSEQQETRKESPMVQETSPLPNQTGDSDIMKHADAVAGIQISSEKEFLNLPGTPQTAHNNRRQIDPSIIDQFPPIRLQTPQGASVSREFPSNEIGSGIVPPSKMDDAQKLRSSLISNGLRRSLQSSVTKMNEQFTPKKIGVQNQILDFGKDQSNSTQSRRTKGPYQFSDRALPLINHINGKFEVNPEIEDMMEAIKGPIGIVAVAGMYRTGKSYLLNRMLLNRQGGFGVGPTINPCTKGLWIWGQPIKGFTPQGEPITVLLVDSEGLGGLDEDQNHDMRIFSLALLLSSYFIYNSMGQIDETALQGLSLVVNLSEHIQSNSSNPNSTIDQLDQFLPNFIWVVRDFALQLKDDHDNDITDAEYLEMALNQKSYSVDDQKNKVRKALLKYFQKRDCTTMVRPLLDEDKLQQLEEMPFEQMRPEFIEQVMGLRRKVLNKMPAKRIGGQPMDAKSWFKMTLQYVEAFNSGRSPNIESSWHFICERKAQECHLLAQQSYDQMIAEAQIPCNQTDLDSLLVQAHEQALQIFKEQTESSVNQSYEMQKQTQKVLQEMEATVLERKSELTKKNANACSEYAQQMLQQLFQQLEQLKQLIAQGDCQAAQQVDFALQQLSQFYDQNCYEFSEKRYFLAECKFQFLLELVAILNVNLSNKERLQQELNETVRDHSNQQVQALKETARAEQCKLQNDLKEAQLQGAELQAQNEILKDQINVLKQNQVSDKHQSELDIQNLKNELEKIQSSQFSLQESQDDQLKEAQRAMKQQESEFVKQRALFEQKIKFLEQNLQEIQAREKNHSSELFQMQNQLQQEMKQMTAKYESELQQKATQLEAKIEQLNDVEQRLVDTQAQLDDLQNKTQTKYTTLDDQAKSYLQQIKTLQAKLTSQDSNEVFQQRIQAMQQDLQKSEQINKDSQEKLKSLQESSSSEQHEAKKKIAMLEQKIEFQQLQLTESKESLDTHLKQHENMLKTLQFQAQANGDQTPRRNRICSGEGSDSEQEANEKIRTLESELAEARQNLEKVNSQIEQHDQTVQQLQSELTRHKDDASYSASENNTLKQQMQEKLNQARQDLKQAQAEHQEALKLAKEELVKEMRELQDNHANDLLEMESRGDQNLQQLKEFFESEKSKAEVRVAEEKERGNRRVQQLTSDFETRIKSADKKASTEQQSLSEQFQHLEQQNQILQQQLANEIQLKQQENQKFTEQLNELKVRLENADKEKNDQYQTYSSQSESERKTLMDKLDQTTRESLDKERQIAALSHQTDRLQDALERAQTGQDSQQKAFEKERQTIQEKLEAAKVKLSTVQDQQLTDKSEFSRQEALLQQQIQFNVKRIEELQRVNESQQRVFDEKIKQCKSEVLEEAQNQLEREQSEKELWQSKYDQKRKALKDVETVLGKRNQELELNKNSLEDQVSRLMQELSSAQEAYRTETSNLKSQLSYEHQSNSSMSGLYSSMQMGGILSQEQFDKQKAQLHECQLELQDLQSLYDRDKALWEGKSQFLEQQKDQYKKDLIECQKKFETTLEQIQKRGSQHKEKMDEKQQHLQKVLEQKFKQQIREIVDANASLKEEQQSKIRRLETELCDTKQHLTEAQKFKLENQTKLDRQLQDVQESERRLQVELDETNAEKQRKISELQKQLQQDKDSFKLRVTDAERKAKDAEAKRAKLFFQFEKDRAEWLVTEEGWKRRVKELDEAIAETEYNRDALKKENEKLQHKLAGLQPLHEQRNSSCGPTSTSQSKNLPFFKLSTSLQAKFSQLPDNQTTSASQIPQLTNNNHNNGLNNSREQPLPSQGQGTNGNSIVNAAFSKFKDLRQSNSTMAVTGTLPQNLQQVNQSTTSMSNMMVNMQSPDHQLEDQKLALKQKHIFTATNSNYQVSGQQPLGIIMDTPQTTSVTNILQQKNQTQSNQMSNKQLVNANNRYARQTNGTENLNAPMLSFTPENVPTNLRNKDYTKDIA